MLIAARRTGHLLGADATAGPLAKSPRTHTQREAYVLVKVLQSYSRTRRGQEQTASNVHSMDCIKEVDVEADVPQTSRGPLQRLQKDAPYSCLSIPLC